MSTNTDDGPNGEAQERATVRLVSEQIRGLERLTDQGFKDLQRQFDSVAALPTTVAKLQADHTALDERERLSDAAMNRRVTALETARIARPTLIISAVIALATVVTLLTQLHLGG